VYAEEDLLVGRWFMFVRFELEPENVVQSDNAVATPQSGAPAILKSAEEPRIFAKEPTLLQMSPKFLQKSLKFLQKSFTFLQKSPTSLQKSHTPLQKSPTSPPKV